LRPGQKNTFFFIIKNYPLWGWGWGGDTPNPSGMGMRFNFSSSLDMSTVTGKYIRVGYGDGEGKTRSHPIPLPCRAAWNNYICIKLYKHYTTWELLIVNMKNSPSCFKDTSISTKKIGTQISKTGILTWHYELLALKGQIGTLQKINK